MMRRDMIAHIQSNFRAMADAQTQVSSGLRIQKASEDPNAATQVLQLKSALRALDQHQRNITSGLSRLSAEEDVLGQLTDALTQAKSLGVAQGTDTANADTRALAKVEVDNLLTFARGLGNTRFLDGYLFGGNRSDVQPFSSNAPPFYNGATPPVGDHQIEIAAGGGPVDTNHNGTELFLDTGVFQSLYDLSTALGNNDVDGIRTALSAIDTSFTKVQQKLGEVGSRTNQLQTMKTSLDSLKLNLDGARSDLEDADIDQATVEVMGRQTTVQAALLTAQHVLSLSLTDYLK
jgi:flagellar hook-associated protein 3 FlgL